MKNLHTEIIKPIIKTIDRVIFGLEDTEIEEQKKTIKVNVHNWLNEEDQEDKIVIKSSN